MRFFGESSVFLILRKYEEADYGYGGWLDTSTSYTEYVGFVREEQKAKDIIKELEALPHKGHYDYEELRDLDLPEQLDRIKSFRRDL